MTALLGVLMALAALAIATVSGWVIVAALSSTAARSKWPARSRAVLLAQLRLSPLALVVVLVPAQVSAFIRFEQGRAESAGPLLIGLAGVGLWLLVDACARGVHCWSATREVLLEWRRHALPLVLANWKGFAWIIRPATPVIAVVGAVRPQLFVARQVVDSCADDEIAAIAAHEAAHVSARDNLVRLLFALTPGAALCRGVAAAIEARWMEAAEEAADIAASRNTDPVALAAALTKVARLTPVAFAPAVAASTLIGGPDLDTRVRRVLSPTPAQRVRGVWTPSLLVLVALLITQLPAVSRALYEVFELLVRRA